MRAYPQSGYDAASRRLGLPFAQVSRFGNFVAAAPSHGSLRTHLGGTKPATLRVACGFLYSAAQTLSNPRFATAGMLCEIKT